jgi:plastocyanin
MRLILAIIGLSVFAISLASTLPIARAQPDVPNAVATTDQTVDVRIEDFFFAPAEISVSAGTTVRWHNFSATMPHTVTSVAPAAVFDSGTLNPGEDFQFTFTTPGIFTYQCDFHPLSMTGKVTVVRQVYLPVITH